MHHGEKESRRLPIANWSDGEIEEPVRDNIVVQMTNLEPTVGSVFRE